MKIKKFFKNIILGLLIVVFTLTITNGCFYPSVISWKKVNESFKSLNETECYASENPEVIIAYSSKGPPIGRLKKDSEYVFFELFCEIGYDSFEFYLENYSYEDYLNFECIALDKNTMVLRATELSQEKYLKLFDDDKKTNILTLKRRELTKEETEYFKSKNNNDSSLNQ